MLTCMSSVIKLMCMIFGLMYMILKMMPKHDMSGAVSELVHGLPTGCRWYLCKLPISNKKWHCDFIFKI